MGEPDEPIRRMLEAYGAAVHAKDVDAFTALYDRDVCVFDAWGAWSYDGIEAWRRVVTGWFGSLGSERAAVEADAVQTIVAGEIAALRAILTFRGISADGEELRAMQNRLTWALRRTDGVWKVVHEHTSAPLDFETAKGILRRPG
jgi:ketosteroid isomerase-like protein